MAGTDCGVSFAAGLAVSTVTAVGRQARYCYEFNNLVTKLGKEQEDLISIRDDVQRQLDKDKANNKEPSGDIQRKFQEANELIDKVDKLKEKAEAKKSCCDGVCANWICRYLLGKNAKEKTEAMEKLNNGLSPKLPFSRRKSLKYVPPSEDFILFKCTKHARNAILMALTDDKKIRIGLHGMGGCGKTSLLEEVRREVEDRKLFKTAFAVVSNNPSYYAIQQSIAECIGLTFKTEKYVRDRAAKLLMAFQEDKKYLVILDDVWQFLDFRDIGIPVRENCKVLLSTRQRQIFDMMKFDAPIDLLLLTNEEALELFKTNAGEIKDPFQEVAQQITYECHRLPVAIKAVTRTLKGKELHAWKDALRTLKDRRRPLNIEKGLEEPYRCLKFSFDELKDEEEISLYLLCALCPSDSEIATEALIRFAFGLDIFRDIDSYETARDKVWTAIDKFKDHCLLLKEGRYVKLHDMFRTLALWEAKEKTQMITGPRQLVAQADYMTHTNRLYCHGAEQFPDQLFCPELEVLIVSNNGGYPSKFPDMFFQELMKLKVLAIKNASIQTKPDLLLPPSIEELKTLRTFCLRGWTLINISVFEKLGMLHTIELQDCVMTELPKELANLESLKLLEVSKCEIEGNPYKVLATYVRLEELYFVENHLPEMMPTAQNVAEFFHQIGSFKDLRRYHLEIGGSKNASRDYSLSKLISINNCDACITIEAFQALPQTLESLSFEKIKGDKESIIPCMFPVQGECLRELKEFVLRDSYCIKWLIDTTNDQLYQTRILFTNLQELKIEVMERLEALCHGPPPSGLFDKLKELYITNCSQLASLFTTTTAQNMVMLEVLEVTGCGKLRYMIKVKSDEHISVEPLLPNLKQISVKRCENLKCILPISVARGLSQLESLEIEDAVKLQYVFAYGNNEKNQYQMQISIDLSAGKILKLINLKNIISFCPENYDPKLPLDKAVVTGCPGLNGMFGLDSEVRHEDSDEAMKQADQLLSMSSGTDLRFNTGVKTAKDLVQAIVRQARYTYRFNTFVADLREQNDSLMSKLKGVETSGDLLQQERVEEARAVIEEVEKLERKAEAGKSCCNGVFPNWLSRYKVGKHLGEMTEAVKQVNERLTVAPQTKIKRRKNVSMFESRKRTYDEILAALEDDAVDRIGLCGMGGCGKTVFIKEVCREVKSLELFDMIAFATVSNPPDIRNIQGQIADCLGLRMQEKTEAARARRLYMRLNNGNKILIILDDIWQVLGLEDVGIPVRKNCKVVLTTRLQHLCIMMDCQKMVYLSLLPEQEAWILFQQHAGVIPDTVKDLALQISRGCHGLPLSIAAATEALKEKPEGFWEEAFMRLRNHETTNRSIDMEIVYKSLKLSFDHLGNDEARSLLFLCALFPEDSKIAVEILTRFAIGLDIFNFPASYEDARMRVLDIIYKLVDSSLLLLVDEKRLYYCMHDLVREAAFMLEKKIQLIMGPEENLIALAERGYMKDTTKLYCHDIKEYPSQLNCPKLELMFLSNDGGCLPDFSDHFFIEMRELKVLAMIHTSILTTPSLLLPLSMVGLANLQTCCLRGWTLNNISILGALKMLATIELLFCVIKELPEELATLRRLSLLEVSGCKIESNPFEVLARCSQLEELYFVENSLPEMVSNDHNVVTLFHQISSFQALRRYHLEIGNSIDALDDYWIRKFISINGFNVPTLNEQMKNMAQNLEVLFLENVQGDCKNIFPDMIPIDRECELTELLLHDSDNIECFIDTTNHPLYQATTVFSRLLKLKLKTMKCFKALHYGPPPFNLFENLQELFIVECSQLCCIVSPGMLNFCHLKHLQLEDCPKLTSILTYSTAQTMLSLEILKVRDCIDLKHIMKDEEEDDGITPTGPIFPKLKQVCVQGCPCLELIIPASLVGGLLQLESLEVEDAGLLKNVFGKYGHEEGQNQGESNSRIDLPVLKVLKLIDLPNITTICPQNCHIMWPDVAKLYRKRCPHLSITSDLDSEAIQQGGGKSREQELELQAKQSRDMVVQSGAEGFYLEDCKMEGIFQLTEPTIDMESKSLSLSCLQSLIMENLPNLRYISEGHKQLHNLRRVKVYKCGEVKCIFSLRMMTYVSALRELIIEDCSQLEQIIEHECYDGQHTGPFRDNCNLQKIAVKSCPILGLLFTVSTAKTLRLMKTLKIEECAGMKVLLKDDSAEVDKRKEIVEEDSDQAIFPSLSFLSLKNLPELIHVWKGGKLKAVKGVMFPESFNLSSLQSLTVKSCPRLSSLFTALTAKTLMWLTSLEITDCSGLEYVVKGKSKEASQGDAEEMLPKLNVLYLVKLPSLIIFYRGIKLQCELRHVHDCPKLKQSLTDVLKPDHLLQQYESPEEEEEEEDYHDDDGEDMDRREEKHKEVEYAIQEDKSNVIEQSSTSCQESKEVDEAAVGNSSVDSLSPTMASGLREVVDNLQHKEAPSHTRSTHSNEDRSFAIVPCSNFHLLKQDGTVQAAAEVLPRSQEIEIVDTPEDLPKQKFCPVDSMNLQESCTKRGKGSLHKDTGLQESKVGTSTQEMIDTEPQVELDPNIAKVQDTTEVHPRSKEFDSNMETAKVGFQKDSAPEESTVRTSSEFQLLIDKQPQIVTDPPQAGQEHKGSLPLPGQLAMHSASSSITTTATPLTAESVTSSSPHAEELVDFHGLFMIKETSARLLEEAFVSYPHLWEWKLSRRTLRICKVGYESLADMLAFLESETPKTMDDSKMEEFENLRDELECFGFNKMWLASIRQRVMDMQAEHNNKLKQLDQLESQISSLEEKLSDARAGLASVKDDLSKPGDVFGFKHGSYRDV